jgi:hypothetical protein
MIKNALLQLCLTYLMNRLYTLNVRKEVYDHGMHNQPKRRQTNYIWIIHIEIRKKMIFKSWKALIAACFLLASTLVYTWPKMEAPCSCETLVNFTGSHSVIFQKTILLRTNVMIWGCKTEQRWTVFWKQYARIPDFHSLFQANDRQC